MDSRLIALLALCAATASNAATIYRCGPAGNVYSDQPCADGRVLGTADERSEAQRAAAQRVAALDRRLAHELQRERLQLAAVAPTAAANLGPRPVVAPAAPPPRKHTVKRKAPGKATHTAPRDADFVAYAPLTLARR